ncbi:hypothetical protein [Paenibacillus arenosi]|uniref:DUF4309 domain-containing protein n=1 Tax=Paenibacillus arenosi TaxID=2774142 RepID=A0ABR9AYR6_9BACL|nr:hypothetical protein [Paenibacillus arenosi]MBD8498066.1 hypothetical protein [Paenibacillus arenosi]
MEKYKKLIYVVVGILIIGLVGTLTYNANKSTNTSFDELLSSSLKGKEITDVTMQEYGGAKRVIHTKSKEEIDAILKPYSHIELITEGSPVPSEKFAIHLTINSGNDIIFGIVVTDTGFVDTYVFEKNKGESYRITNQFDFKSIHNLFEK